MASFQADSDSDSDNSEAFFGDEFFTSVRTKTGLEVGIRVQWPDVKPFTLSTCLSSDAIAPLFHGTQWAGTRIWQAAVVALQYLLQQRTSIPITEQQTVLELGCGIGVPGIILNALTNCHVILSDRDSLMEQLQHNLQTVTPTLTRNDHNTDTMRIQAHELDWSRQGVQQLLQTTSFANGFDVVLNCDCIFEPLYGESWKKLVECQEALLQINPSTYMLTSVERRRFDGIENYLAAIEASNIVKRVQQIPLDPLVYPEEVELYRLYGEA